MFFKHRISAQNISQIFFVLALSIYTQMGGGMLVGGGLFILSRENLLSSQMMWCKDFHKLTL